MLRAMCLVEAKEAPLFCCEDLALSASSPSTMTGLKPASLTVRDISEKNMASIRAGSLPGAIPSRPIS